MKKNILLFIIVLTGSISFAQTQSGIGTKTPTTTLEVIANATDNTVLDGISVPKLTCAQIVNKQLNANGATGWTTAQIGTIVYITEAVAGCSVGQPVSEVAIEGVGFYVLLESVTTPGEVEFIKLALKSGSNTTDWLKAGNAATDPSIDFVGTTDAQDLVLRTNNAEALRVDTEGNVGIGTTTPATNLQIVGNPTDVLLADGVTLPGLTGDQLVAKSNNVAFAADETGTLVYVTAIPTGVPPIGANAVNVTRPGLYYWDGTLWQQIVNGNTAWALAGNANTDPATNFIGTTDTQDFVVRTDNAERLRVAAAGNVGIGTTAPSQRLQISGNQLFTNDGDFIRFPHTNETDGNDGKIGAGLFAEGLNIIGSQTVGGNGRLTSVFGFLRLLNLGAGSTTDNFITADGSGNVRRSSETLADLTQNIYTADGTIPAGVRNVAMTGNLNFDSNSLFVDATNNRVGIGTAAPEERLHVAGSGIIGNHEILGDRIELNVRGAGDRLSYIDLHAHGAAGANDFSGRLIRFPGENGALQLVNTGTGPQYFGTNNSIDMTIGNGGNVGIGNLNPGAKLSIFGGPTTATENANDAIVANAGGLGFGSAIITLRNDNGNFFGAQILGGLPDGVGTSPDDLDGTSRFGINVVSGGTKTRALTINDSGNVGIGNANPGAKLSIFGGNTTGTENANDAIVANAAGTGFGSAIITLRNDNGNFFGAQILGGLPNGVGIFPDDLDGSSRFGINVVDGGTKTRALTILSSGAVGLGTTAPSQRLQISGNQLFTNDGDFIRFPHTNETDGNDGKIGAGLFAEGLNIIGSQTVGGNGRLTSVFGFLRLLNLGAGSTTDNFITADGSGNVRRSSETLADLTQNIYTADGTIPAGVRNVAMTGNLNFDSNSLFVDATNNRVGIGTAAPEERLHVVGSGIIGNHEILGDRIELNVRGAGDRLSYIDLHAHGAAGANDFSGRLIRFPGENGALQLVNTGTGPQYFGTNNSIDMTIGNGGNVGIGTTAPQSRLDFNNHNGNAFDAFADYSMLLFNTGDPLTSYGIGIEPSSLSFNGAQHTFKRNAATTFMIGAETDVFNNFHVNAALLDAAASPGAAGQVLQSTGTTTQWVTPPGITVGDVKTGFQTGDHNGWVLLNGRGVAALSASQQAAWGTLGIAGAFIPQTSGGGATTATYLADIDGNAGSVGSIGGDPDNSWGSGDLPQHRHSGATAASGAHSHTYTDTRRGGVFGLNAGGSESYNFGENVPTLNTSTAGNHAHSFQTNTGDFVGGLIVPTNGRTLDINTFVYLGL